MAAHQYVYHMHKLSKAYPGGKQVLKDISLSFLPGAKIGVVGLNGAGKSTLLKIMAGVVDDFIGEARPADGIKVGYLPQEPELDETKDVLGNAMEGVAEKKAILDRYKPIDPVVRGAEYRKTGWTTFDPAAPPYKPNETEIERIRRREAA